MVQCMGGSGKTLTVRLPTTKSVTMDERASKTTDDTTATDENGSLLLILSVGRTHGNDLEGGGERPLNVVQIPPTTLGTLTPCVKDVHCKWNKYESTKTSE